MSHVEKVITQYIVFSINIECSNEVIGNAFATSSYDGQKTTGTVTLGKLMDLAYSTIDYGKCHRLSFDLRRYLETSMVSKQVLMYVK